MGSVKSFSSCVSLQTIIRYSKNTLKLSRFLFHKYYYYIYIYFALVFGGNFLGRKT